MPLQRDGIDSRDNRIAPLVERQFPAFVREDHPKFIKFMQKYYEHLEREGSGDDKGGPFWALRSLLDLQDLDLTEDRLLVQFHRELAATIPQQFFNSVNKRTIYKNILDFHRARGTEKSYEFLFRILFNDKIGFYYPHTDIFRSSDGIWVVNRTVRVLAVDGNPFDLVDKKIKGTGSQTQAVVERVLKYQKGIFAVYELFLTPRTIDGGVFESNEIIETEDGSIRAKLYTCVTGVKITNPGKGYSEGDTITIGNSKGTGCVLVVGAVGPNGEVKSVNVVDPGVNYDPITAADGSGTGLKVSLGSVSSGQVTSIQIVDPGSNYQQGNIIRILSQVGEGCQITVNSVHANGGVKDFTISQAGTGYIIDPQVTFGAKSDTATGVAIKGPLVTYPGFYLNENGMLSTTKYLQDSFFYQQFSYVIRSNQSINLYRDVVQKTLHPAGYILFGSVFADSLVKAPAKFHPFRKGKSSIREVQHIVTLHDPVRLRGNTRTVGRNIQLSEHSMKIGPTYDWLDRFKFSALPHDPNFDVRRLPGCKLWTDSNNGIVVDSQNRVSLWKNRARGSTDGWQAPSFSSGKPLLTRNDNKENLIKRSSVYTQGGWINAGADILDYEAVDSSGDPKAAKMTLIAGAGEHKITQDSTVSCGSLAEAGQSYVLSFEVKKSAVAEFVYIGDTGDSVPHSATFNIDDEFVDGTSNITDSSIEDLGNGWYRLSIEFTRTTTGNFVFTLAVNDTGHTASPESWTALGTEIVFFSKASCRNVLADTGYVPTFEGPEIRGHLGKRLIRFDGENDHLQTVDAASDLITEEEAHIYIAFKARTVGTNASTVTENEAVIQDINSQFGLFLKSGGTMILLHDDGSEATVERPLEAGQFYVAILRHTNGTIELEQNETHGPISDTSGDTGVLTGGFRLGWSLGDGTGGGGSSSGGYFPDDYFGEGYMGELFPEEDAGGGEAGANAYSQISVGEVIICNQRPPAALEREFLGWFKKKWLNIQYRRESHEMGVANETYWDQYANFQVKDRAHIKPNDLKLYPTRKTQMSYDPYIVAKEVISDFEEILVDIDPRLEILRSLDEDDKVDWIKDKRRTILRFEPGTDKPEFLQSENDFSNQPYLHFDGGQELISQSLASVVFDTDSVFGWCVLKVTDVSQPTSMILCSNTTPAVWSLNFDASKFRFVTSDGATTTIVGVNIIPDVPYLVEFSLTGGVQTIRVIGNGTDTTDSVSSVGDIDSLAAEICVGGHGSEYFVGDVGRIILGKEALPSNDRAFLLSILLNKYGITGA